MDRRRFLWGSGLGVASMVMPNLAFAQRQREWVVGQSIDLSGPQQTLGRDYFTGAKLAFDIANAEGGTAGRRWRHLSQDDGGDARTARANVLRFVADQKADVLFGMLSDECVAASIQVPEFMSSDCLLFAPMSGTINAMANDRVVHLRASYAAEVAAIFKQFAQLSLSNFVIAHTPSASSIATRNTAVNLLREQKVPEPRAVVLKEDGSNADALANSIKDAGLHAVVILADSIPAALLAQALRARMPGLFICMTSNVDNSLVQQFLGTKSSTGLIFSRVVPNARKGNELITREFSRVLAKFFDEAPTEAGLEGFIAARSLIRATQRLGGIPSASQLARLRGLGKQDLGGWSVSFNGLDAGKYVDTSIVSRTGQMLG